METVHPDTTDPHQNLRIVFSAKNLPVKIVFWLPEMWKNAAIVKTRTRLLTKNATVKMATTEIKINALTVIAPALIVLALLTLGAINVLKNFL